MLFTVASSRFKISAKKHHQILLTGLAICGYFNNSIISIHDFQDNFLSASQYATSQVYTVYVAHSPTLSSFKYFCLFGIHQFSIISYHLLNCGVQYEALYITLYCQTYLLSIVCTLVQISETMMLLIPFLITFSCDLLNLCHHFMSS